MVRSTKIQFYMQLTEKMKERSTCKRLQVGCMIMNEEMTQILSMGYNGNYKGGPNECDSEEAGNCGCIHAEVNALIKPRSSEGMIMFITDSPCVSCAKLIINAGIKTVYYKNEYRIKDGLVLLRNNGITAYQT